MGCIINSGPVFFLFSLVLDLAYIEYSVYQIWSGYMQYSRCYNNSNKCLFLVFQQTEVLLNFFWWVYVSYLHNWPCICISKTVCFFMCRWYELFCTGTNVHHRCCSTRCHWILRKHIIVIVVKWLLKAGYVSINCCKISKVCNYEFLGMIIDSNLGLYVIYVTKFLIKSE